MREGCGHAGAVRVGDVRLRGQGGRRCGDGAVPETAGLGLTGGRSAPATFAPGSPRAAELAGRQQTQGDPPAPERSRLCACSARGPPTDRDVLSARGPPADRDAPQRDRRLRAPRLLGIPLAPEPAQSGVLTWFPLQDHHELPGRPVSRSLLPSPSPARPQLLERTVTQSGRGSQAPLPRCDLCTKDPGTVCELG